MLGVTKGEEKDGTLQDYLKQPNVELTSLSLKSEQVIKLNRSEGRGVSRPEKEGGSD